MTEQPLPEPQVPEISPENREADITQDKNPDTEPTALERWRACIQRVERFKDDSPLVEQCAYETRLAVACWVMRHVWAHAQEGGSYRHLIYHRLGFGPDAYAKMLYADALSISNEFTVMSARPDDTAFAKVIELAAAKLEVGSVERHVLLSAMFRFEELAASNCVAVEIIEKQRAELLGQGLPE